MTSYPPNLADIAIYQAMVGQAYLNDLATYGLAIRHGIGETIEVDGLLFKRIPKTHAYDCVSTGISSDIFEMVGTGKQYKITITPILTTHRRNKDAAKQI